MWHEFPTDIETFGLENQFMYGESLLIIPKLGMPTPAADNSFWGQRTSTEGM
jgi:hypothetical protein